MPVRCAANASAVCPVDIDLPRMLLDLRRDLVAERKHQPFYWRAGLRVLGPDQPLAAPVRSGGNDGEMGQQSRCPNTALFRSGRWGDGRASRDVPEFAPHSFHQLWDKREKGKIDEQP